jgi:hypothetical protein
MEIKWYELLNKTDINPLGVIPYGYLQERTSLENIPELGQVLVSETEFGKAFDDNVIQENKALNIWRPNFKNLQDLFGKFETWNGQIDTLTKSEKDTFLRDYSSDLKNDFITYAKEILPNIEWDKYLVKGKAGDKSSSRGHRLQFSKSITAYRGDTLSLENLIILLQGFYIERAVRSLLNKGIKTKSIDVSPSADNINYQQNSILHSPLKRSRKKEHNKFQLAGLALTHSTDTESTYLQKYYALLWIQLRPSAEEAFLIEALLNNLVTLTRTPNMQINLLYNFEETKSHLYDQIQSYIEKISLKGLIICKFYLDDLIIQKDCFEKLWQITIKSIENPDSKIQLLELNLPKLNQIISKSPQASLQYIKEQLNITEEFNPPEWLKSLYQNIIDSYKFDNVIPKTSDTLSNEDKKFISQNLSIPIKKGKVNQQIILNYLYTLSIKNLIGKTPNIENHDRLLSFILIMLSVISQEIFCNSKVIPHINICHRIFRFEKDKNQPHRDSIYTILTRFFKANPKHSSPMKEEDLDLEQLDEIKNSFNQMAQELLTKGLLEQQIVFQDYMDQIISKINQDNPNWISYKNPLQEIVLFFLKEFTQELTNSVLHKHNIFNHLELKYRLNKAHKIVLMDYSKTLADYWQYKNAK